MSIDPSALASYRDVMGADADSFVIDLIDTFLDNSQPLLDALYSSLAAGDLETFIRSAHTLKSNSAVFGAHILTGFCKELESIGRSGSILGVQPKIDQLQAEYKQVCRELVDLRQSLKV